MRSRPAVTAAFAFFFASGSGVARASQEVCGAEFAEVLRGGSLLSPEALEADKLEQIRQRYEAARVVPLKGGISRRELREQIEPMIHDFEQLEAEFWAGDFPTWVEHEGPKPKSGESAGDYSQRAYERFRRATKPRGVREPKDLLRCLLSNPKAMKSLAIDFSIGQGVLWAQNYQKIAPTFEQMRATLGKGLPKGPKRELTAKEIADLRFPLDASVNGLLWTLVFAETSCRNVFGGAKPGSPMSDRPPTLAERTRRAFEGAKRLSKIVVFSDATYLGLGSLQDKLMGKQNVDPVKDYLTREPLQFLFSGLWSPFKGALILDPIKMKGIPAVVGALNQNIDRWAVNAARQRVATGAKVAVDATANVGWRMGVSAEGNWEFFDLYQKAIVPTITDGLEKLHTQVEDFLKSNARTKQVAHGGVIYRLQKSPDGNTFDIDVEFDEAARQSTEARFDAELDHALEKLPRTKK